MNKQEKMQAAKKRIYELIFLLNSWEEPIQVTDGSERIVDWQLNKFTKKKNETN